MKLEPPNKSWRDSNPREGVIPVGGGKRTNLSRDSNPREGVIQADSTVAITSPLDSNPREGVILQEEEQAEAEVEGFKPP